MLTKKSAIEVAESAFEEGWMGAMNWAEDDRLENCRDWEYQNELRDAGAAEVLEIVSRALLEVNVCNYGTTQKAEDVIAAIVQTLQEKGIEVEYRGK